MNSVQLVGRLTRDPDVRYSDNGASVARFTLAVDRRFKKDGGDEADFISCVAFGKTAEFLEKWFRKGQRLGLYTTDVVVENVEFVESRGTSASDNEPQQRPASTSAIGDGFMNIPDGVEDEGLPFN